MEIPAHMSNVVDLDTLVRLLNILYQSVHALSWDYLYSDRCYMNRAHPMSDRPPLLAGR